MNKIFLVLCSLLAIFITLTGSNLTLQLIFAPVALYLLAITVRQFIRPKTSPEVNLSHKYLEVALFTTLFVVLIGRGIITISTPSKPIPDQPIIIKPITPTPTSIPTLTVTYPDPKILVSLRARPTSQSELITKIPSGTTVTYTELTDGWYHVQLVDGVEGWIKAEFAVFPTQTP